MQTTLGVADAHLLSRPRYIYIHYCRGLGIYIYTTVRGLGMYIHLLSEAYSTVPAGSAREGGLHEQMVNSVKVERGVGIVVVGERHRILGMVPGKPPSTACVIGACDVCWYASGGNGCSPNEQYCTDPPINTAHRRPAAVFCLWQL